MKKLFFAAAALAIFIVVLLVWKDQNQPEATPSAVLSPTASVTLTETRAGNKTYEVLITSSGLSQQTLNIKTGDTVKFVNNDSVPHWPASGLHPTHTVCPGFDSAKGLAGGEFYSFTFTVAKTCPFHDHLNAGNSNYKGTINVSE